VSAVLNVAAYLFVPLENLDVLRESLLASLQAQGVRGTILLAPEGINLFLAGEAEAVERFLAELRADPRLSALVEKQSWSAAVPFKRTRVKIKREIVPLGKHNLHPSEHPAPYLSAARLKAWIASGRAFVLLDTRNRFEYQMGSFSSAVDLGIDDFRAFPDAIAARLAEWQDQPIVTFCTGGIRCEKAAPLMRSLGFTEVYQLEGGILRYFEDEGGTHYRGHCFVFDDRVALNPSLDAVT